MVKTFKSRHQIQGRNSNSSRIIGIMYPYLAKWCYDSNENLQESSSWHEWPASYEIKNPETTKKGGSNQERLFKPIEEIFHDRQNGHLSQNSVRNVWKRVLSKCGISHRKVHTTRHTFTSMMLAANIPVAYVSKMLGHSSIQMTVDIYGHLLPDRDKSAINILDQFSENGTPPAPTNKKSLVTQEDYEALASLVAMQGIEPRTLRIWAVTYSCFYNIDSHCFVLIYHIKSSIKTMTVFINQYK